MGRSRARRAVSNDELRNNGLRFRPSRKADSVKTRKRAAANGPGWRNNFGKTNVSRATKDRSYVIRARNRQTRVRARSGFRRQHWVG